MARKAAIRFRSLRSNLVHLPLSIYASLAQQQTRPQGLIIHLKPLVSASSSSRPAKEAYLGWSGLAAASSLASLSGEAETVEVDPEVALSLGWAEGTLVEISVIHNPPRARSVSVTPLTADDWEILEQHASFLENNLLSQLRAAQSGQVIDAWVAGKSKVRIKVDETNPVSTTSSAVLLTADTEVYVTPRSRERDTAGKSRSGTAVSAPPLVAPAQVANMKRRSPDVKLRRVPSRVACRWGDPHDAPTNARTSTNSTCWCSPATCDKLQRKLKLNSKEIYLAVEDLAEEAIGDAASDVYEAGSVPGDEEEEEANRVRLLQWEDMPDGCIVVQGTKDPPGWGNVSVTAAATPRASRNTRATIAVATWPSPTASSPLAGVTELLAEAVAYLSYASQGMHPKPLLLTGGKGSGKTTLARQIALQLEQDREILLAELYVDVGRLDIDGRLAVIKEEISSWFEGAVKQAPCLLVLDNLDMLLVPEDELSSSPNPVILAEHFCSLASMDNAGVVVLCTAGSSASLHPLLGSKHVFGDTVKLPNPTKAVRQEILEMAVEARQSGQSASSADLSTPLAELDFVTLGSNTEGYAAADLVDLVANAVQQSIIRGAKTGRQSRLEMQDFVDAQVAFTPKSLRGVTLQKSEVKWSDVGGLREPRRVLRETLEWPTKYAQIFASCPLRLRSGLLLYGYPGCGKTLLASAVAKECGLNFISVKGPEILNKYIGASEKAVRDLFERASAAKPCVLFFDEFDSIAPKRGHDSTGVTDRVVNQMLTEMDGAQGLDGVYVLAATSRPDLIDPALLRPGRLDKSLLCDMPDQQDRLEIMTALSRKLSVAPTVDLEQLSFDTDGLSGADLQAMMYNAHLEVIHSQIESKSGGVESKSKGKGKGKGKGPQLNGHVEAESVVLASVQALPELSVSRVDKAAMEARIQTILSNSKIGGSAAPEAMKTIAHEAPIIEQMHLLRSLANTRPSVAPAERRRLERIYSLFSSDRDGTMGDGDLGRDTGTRMSLM